MGYPRRRFRRRRGGGFLVIAATALIVVLVSHPAIHYETASFAHASIFIMTMLASAAIAGMAWAITTNSIQNKKMARTSFWQPRTRPMPAPHQTREWQPLEGQVVDAEIVKPHWETPGRKS